MNRFFKIFLIVVLSVFSTLNLSANDTFFSIEKSNSSIKELVNAGSDLFANFTHLKNLPADAKTFLSAKNWDNALLTKLDGDLATTTFKNVVDANPQLIDAWKVLEDAGVDDVLRRDANVLNAFDNAVIPNDRLIHSTVGDFTYVPGTNNISRMKGGGHGQSNLDFLDANNIEYNIVNEFSNGVRVGNVPLHKSVPKRTGSNQSWFPNTWTDLDIENAGKFISSLPEFTNASDGAFIFKSFKGVEVGVIKTNGGVGTVFANSVQP